MLSTSSYKGTRDFFPDEMRLRRWMFGKLENSCKSFGFEEVMGPLLEPFELYAAKTGEEIVNQQLYHFVDRGDRKVAIRPEMTPTLARMASSKIHELAKPIRWFSIANFHRYEKPQRGRLREFWQLNVDVLGGDETLADAEILEMAYRIVESFGGEAFCGIQINDRRIIDHFFQEVLSTEPSVALQVTKLIDAKAKIGEEAFRGKLEALGLGAEKAALLEKFLKSDLEELEKWIPSQGVDHLKKVFQILRSRGISNAIEFNPSVLRGLDYYTGMVFEVYDHAEENRRAMFGGGRYDNLLGLFGVKPGLSGVGFGMGDVTLEDFLTVHGLIPKISRGLDVFVSVPSQEFLVEAGKLAQRLRASGWSAVTALEISGFGPQLKQASKLQANWAVLFGESEWKEKAVVLKDLRSGAQTKVALGEIENHIKE